MNRNNSNSPTRKPQDEAGSGGFAGEMFTHLRVSIVATIVLGVIVSGIYPAMVWGLAQALFHHQANGSLIKKDGTPTDSDSEAVGRRCSDNRSATSSIFIRVRRRRAMVMTRPPAAARTSAR